jgi:uncharacterized membrane protein affecting hemolysin expression
MGNTKKSFARKLPTLTLIFSLITGCFIALILGLQLNSMAENQQNQLGQALSSQLAKIVRDPILRHDNLSLQLEVDEMLNLKSVHQVIVYDASHQVLAKTQRSQNTDSNQNLHASPITIENAIAGYVSIQLDPLSFDPPLQTLRQSFMLLWLAVVLALLFFSFKFGKQLSGRLNHLIQQLPGETPESMDELSCLESRVEPLLATRQQLKEPVDGQQQKYCTLLAIVCKNLSRLESLINREHFESVMAQLDYLINDAASLYGATRLSADRCSIYLEFSGETEHSDHPLRALYCATAIQLLSKKLLGEQGIELELASAISQGKQQLSSSQILNERSHQEHIKVLQTLLEKAVNGEILLDKNTSTHTALEDVNLSPLAEDSPLFRVEKLSETSEKLVHQQLALLARNL